MKARVKLTGDIVEATFMHEDNGKLWYDIDKSGYCLTDEELDFNFERKPDYWEKLKHQYAGMAMQGMISNEYTHKLYLDNKNYPNGLLNDSIAIATALVEKLKNE